ncbi:(d)CMP kinase [Roseospira goensis]|uniref:Cytidylate kinase n=1 Tax=Roseospira goensis TaxID=391922 RepID=A0A7W6RZH5_9PROT|nr:cytidylate kinase [Roseospira goensis]
MTLPPSLIDDPATAGALAAVLSAATVGESRLSAALVPCVLRPLLAELGAQVAEGGGTVAVTGRGLGGLRSPETPLDARAVPGALGPLCGLLAGHAVSAVVRADRLPDGLVATLERAGAQVVVGGSTTAPLLTVRGTASPLAPDCGGPAALPPAAAMAALAVGLTAPGESRVALPPALAGVAFDLLAAFGVPVRLEPAGAVLDLVVTGEAETAPAALPADWPVTPVWLAALDHGAGPLTVAIDGPAAAGKGTLARAVAARLGLAYLDTGLLYRATGLAVRRAGGSPDDPAATEQAARALSPDDLNDPALRGEAAGDAASRVAAIPAVRAALLEFQRAFAAQPPDGARGAVLDGRDIGSVVCPEAPVKLFVTARVETRARRRFLELRERGTEVIESRILRDMEERDARDRSRSVAPLVPVADAVVLDTSDLDRDGALSAALALTGARVWAWHHACARADGRAGPPGAPGATDTGSTGDS